MKYSNELIAEVKEVYGSDSDAYRHAIQGNTILGRYLDDSSHGGISVDTILAANTLGELKVKAANLKKRKELCNKWYNEYQKQL